MLPRNHMCLQQRVPGSGCIDMLNVPPEWSRAQTNLPCRLAAKRLAKEVGSHS
jgi:hypothetical protein